MKYSDYKCPDSLSSIFLSSTLITLVTIAISGCNTPSNGLDQKQERSAEAVTENIVTAESMGYDIKVTDLSPLYAYDINNAGQIVGSKQIKEHVFRGFLWEDGKVTILEPLSGDTSSSAIAINNNGRVLGRSDNVPITWNNGHICTLCALGPESTVYDINDKRQILGYYRRRTPGGNSSTHFVLDNKKFTYLKFTIPGYPFGEYAISNTGRIAGTREVTIDTPPGYSNRAFSWINGSFRNLGTLTGGNERYFHPESHGYDVNDKKQIVGSSTSEEYSEEAFLWGRTKNNIGYYSFRMRGLGTLGGDESVATGINNKSQIVGTSKTASGDWHVFLWENGTMIDLGVEASDNPDTYGYQMGTFSINDNGQIIGSVRTSSGPDQSILIEIEKN